MASFLGGMNLMGMLLNGGIWLVGIAFALALAVLYLYVKKWKKLQYPVLIFTDLGDRKQGIEFTKAGWFKKNQKFGGLLEYGKDEYLKVKDGRRIQGASSKDFHEVNGRRGLLCKRKDDDPRILVPLSKMEIQNENLLAAIASTDLRDAAVDLVEEVHHETRNRTAEIVQWVLLGGTIIFALISIIMITRMVQQGQREAAELILKAGECGVQALRSSAP